MQNPTTAQGGLFVHLESHFWVSNAISCSTVKVTDALIFLPPCILGFIPKNTWKLRIPRLCTGLLYINFDVI